VVDGGVEEADEDVVYCCEEHSGADCVVCVKVRGLVLSGAMWERLEGQIHTGKDVSDDRHFAGNGHVAPQKPQKESCNRTTVDPLITGRGKRIPRLAECPEGADPPGDRHREKEDETKHTTDEKPAHCNHTHTFPTSSTRHTAAARPPP
jgi:hypothetical protein